MILAGATPRATVLLAKYVSLMLTLAIPLLLGLLVSVTILIASGAETARLIPWGRVVVIALTSFLYLSVFVLLGMFVSARASEGSNAMAVLLLIWVVVLLLVPTLGRVVSQRLCRAPTTEEFERARSDARREVDDRIYAGVYGKKAGGTAPDRNDPNVDPQGRARYTNDETAAIS